MDNRRHDDLTTASHRLFHYSFSYARMIDPLVREYTSPEAELDRSARYFLSRDTKAGFGIKLDGTLIALFSLTGGRGHAMLERAVKEGATKLECFDGYLVDFYGQHGFTVVRREANWTEGEPDVVWMERTSA